MLVYNVEHPGREMNWSGAYILDTNVLAALQFPHIKWKQEKVAAYSGFILKLLENNATLYVSTLSLQELYHLAEKIAYNHYCIVNELRQKQFRQKQYRKIVSEREKLAETLQAIHSVIAEQFTLIEEHITIQDTQNFINAYAKHSYDPMDFLLIEHNLKRCKNVITDDKDFQIDSRLNIFCYRPEVRIKEKEQGAFS